MNEAMQVGSSRAGTSGMLTDFAEKAERRTKAMRELASLIEKHATTEQEPLLWELLVELNWRR